MTYHAGEILQDFWNHPDRQRHLRLAALWTSWPDIVGPEIAGLAKPLGRNKQTLLLGVDDSMAMQEMHFLTQQVLQAVNNALGEVFFDKVHIDLLSGRSSLDSLQQSLMRGRTPKERTSVRILQDAGVPVQKLGRQIGNFSDIPALERCYEAYVRAFGPSRKRTNQ